MRELTAKVFSMAGLASPVDLPAVQETSIPEAKEAPKPNNFVGSPQTPPEGSTRPPN